MWECNGVWVFNSSDLITWTRRQTDVQWNGSVACFADVSIVLLSICIGRGTDTSSTVVVDVDVDISFK
jgi:hypothetical protein